MIYREAAGESPFVALLSEVREFQIRYDEIGQHALPVEPSRDLLRTLMEDDR